jgi:hypothetical protein
VIPVEGEPLAGPYRVAPLTELVDLLLARAPADRTAVVAVDGRGSGGKTALCTRLVAAVPDSAVVHTDDIAWWHAVMDWDDLLGEGILAPVRRGEAVRYRPPQWDLRERPGSIDVPAGTRVVFVDGVGSSRRALGPLLDAAVWVQADAGDIERRNRVKVDAGEIDPVGDESWMAEENPFLLADRPWARADVVVAGTPVLPYDPATEVLLAPPPVPAAGRPG